MLIDSKLFIPPLPDPLPPNSPPNKLANPELLSVAGPSRIKLNGGSAEEDIEEDPRNGWEKSNGLKRDSPATGIEVRGFLE